MTQPGLQKTALYNKHIEAGAKMTGFHGWNLPLQFTSIIEECKTVRKTAGLFDISHMGKAEVKGKDALRLLQSLTVNDLSKTSEGQAQYTAMVDEKGGIIDDLLVYHVSRSRFFLCLNAANADKDISWIAQFALQYPDVEVRNLTRQYALLALQGPNSEAIMKSIGASRAAAMEYFNFMITAVAEKNVMISRTGYTGEDGFEIYCDWRDADILWDTLMSKGRQWGIKPAGLGARDILRLEMGYLLHGQDADISKNPFEAGLGWIVKLDKEEKAFAKDVLTAKKQAGPARRLVGFCMEERGGIPRHGFSILAQGRIIGEVTSGALSPNLNKAIGMGYLLSEYAQPGTPIQIDIRDKAVAATVVKRPFIPARTKKAKPGVIAEKADAPSITEEEK